MKSTSDIFKKYTCAVRETLWLLGLHAFSIVLLLILVAFVLGGLVFYKYAFLAQNEEPKTSQSILKFDEKVYQEVIGELQIKEQSIDNF